MAAARHTWCLVNLRNEMAGWVRTINGNNEIMDTQIYVTRQITSLLLSI
jgi:hypothetical protein